MRDIDNSYLRLEAHEESAIDDLLGHSVTYRVAVGPKPGARHSRQSVPAREQDSENSQLAWTAGFSLHAGVAAKAHQRRKLERLCRYTARAVVATERLALTRQGNVRYTLKIPYRDGTTHIILEPRAVGEALVRERLPQGRDRGLQDPRPAPYGGRLAGPERRTDPHRPRAVAAQGHHDHDALRASGSGTRQGGGFGLGVVTFWSR
ncbi:MAG: transposase [Arenicellales bacterium]